uniref:Sulfhydryl oxidase n=4 Tax=Meloidogyne TaxID=189290 RepID=A0A915P8P8_9BILA
MGTLSSPVLRGYTCGLWTLFHVLTVNGYRNGQKDNSFDPLRLLLAIRDWVLSFFACDHCRVHFRKMTTKTARIETSINREEDVFLYLWKAHNLVNSRLHDLTLLSFGNMNIKRSGNSSSSLLILPLLLCLGFLLWNHCQANEHHETVEHWVKRVLQEGRYPSNRDNIHNEKEEGSISTNTNIFEERRDSGLSMESKEIENDNYVEPVIPWFSDWEKMVKEQEAKKKKHPKKSLPIRHSPIQNIQERPRHIQGPCLLRRNKPVQHRTYPRSYEFPGFELSIPRKWDWRNVDGINFCSPTRNQHIPVYCGGSLNDRFNIARKNRWPMTSLSPQEIIACNGRGRGCNGGTAEDVFEHAKTVGLVEEGCNNFKADFGKLTGRLQMMSEIHNRGPISCTMGCTPQFDLNYTSGIYREHGEYPPNHIVSVTGWDWDEETKTEYWIVRNSWGEAWGEMGWFRVVTSLFNGGRGDQFNMGIERECYFADPDVSNLN